MTATDQDIGGPADPYHAGDSLDIVVDVGDDLSGATVEWAMSVDPGESETLSEGDTGVDSSVTDAASGEITVSIDAGVTDDLAGTFYHEVRVEDSGGNTAVVTRGIVRIEARVNQ